MSKFKVGDMVMFKAYENNISFFDDDTPLDLYEPQKVMDVKGRNSIMVGDDKD